MTEPTDEQWRAIPGYEGSYEASDLGRIRSLDRWEPNTAGIMHFYRGRLLKTGKATPLGHRNVTLAIMGNHRTRFVHQLVLEAFGLARPDGGITRHLDGNPSNNNLSNLMWGTHQENSDDRREHGTMHYSLRRGFCRQGHRLDDKNAYRYPNGTVKCRRCRADQQLAYIARKKLKND